MSTLFPDLDSAIADKQRKRAKQRAYYAANRDKSIAATKASTKKRRAHLRSIVDAFKSTACASCGDEFPPVAMQCHHRDPDEKAAPISRLVHRGVNEDVLLDELAKCDVLCANCHMMLHHGSDE